MEVLIVVILIFSFFNFLGDNKIMANLADLEAKVDRILAAVADVAADLQKLKDQVGTGMSQADVDKFAADLDAAVAGLEAVASAQ